MGYMCIKLILEWHRHRLARSVLYIMAHSGGVEQKSRMGVQAFFLGFLGGVMRDRPRNPKIILARKGYEGDGGEAALPGLTFSLQPLKPPSQPRHIQTLICLSSGH